MGELECLFCLWFSFYFLKSQFSIVAIVSFVSIVVEVGFDFFVCLFCLWLSFLFSILYCSRRQSRLGLDFRSF